MQLKSFFQKTSVIVLGFLILFHTAISQPKELTVGDRLPDLKITGIINYPGSSVKLSDFNGKLLIIDFWGTTCSSCIAALPKFHEMQTLFANKLQVLTVADYGTKEQVEKTFQHFRKLQRIQLPVIINNLTLKQLFPHEFVSHVVWIDGKGIVKAITGTEYVTKENIETILAGKEINWPIKRDAFAFDYNKTLLQYESNAPLPSFIYSSAFTGYIEGIEASDKISIDSVKKTLTSNHFNHSLLQLCDGALNGSGSGYIDLKHLVLEVKDKNRYIWTSGYYTEWEKKNTYCYSISLPPTMTQEEINETIKKDLTHWLNVLGVYIKKEIRSTKVLILKRTNMDSTLLKSKGGKYEYGLDEEGSVKWLKNYSFSNLIWHLNRETPEIPWVFDETGIDGSAKVDMEFHLDSFKNIPELRRELNKYGLDLIEGIREMEMYVITEKRYNDN